MYRNKKHHHFEKKNVQPNLFFENFSKISTKNKKSKNFKLENLWNVILFRRVFVFGRKPYGT